MLILRLVSSILQSPPSDADTGIERSKLRIVAGPGVSTSGANPYLLSAEEEKVVKAKQRDLRHDLRVPRR